MSLQFEVVRQAVAELVRVFGLCLEYEVPRQPGAELVRVRGNRLDCEVPRQVVGGLVRVHGLCWQERDCNTKPLLLRCQARTFRANTWQR